MNGPVTIPVRNSLVEWHKSNPNKIIVATMESFAPGQVVRIGRNPIMRPDEMASGLVLRAATRQEYVACCRRLQTRKAPSGATRPHNRALLDSANFYEVSVD